MQPSSLQPRGSRRVAYLFKFNPPKVPSLARSVHKPLKVPSLARSVLKPLKEPSLARSVPKPLSIFALRHVLVK